MENEEPLVRLVVWPVPDSLTFDMIFLDGGWVLVEKGRYKTGDVVTKEEIENGKV